MTPAPDIPLIIEVAETSLEFDTEVKLDLYAIIGVHEYWVADLRSERVLAIPILPAILIRPRLT